MLNLMLTSLWITIALISAMFLWWSRRAELASAGGWGRALERHHLALATGGAAPPRPELTPEQRHALRALTAPQVRLDVLEWLRRLGVRRQDREDLCQAALVEAVRSIGSFDPTKGSPRPWLNQIVVHVAAHHRALARHHREDLLEDPAHELLDDDLQADAAIEAAEQLLDLHRMLAALPDGERAIVVGHDVDERPMAELAEERGLPVSTAYKHRARAFNVLVALARRVRA